MIHEKKIESKVGSRTLGNHSAKPRGHKALQRTINKHKNHRHRMASSGEIGGREWGLFTRFYVLVPNLHLSSNVVKIQNDYSARIEAL